MPAWNRAMLTLAREARGLNQKELAGRIGAQQGAISKIENGVQAMTDEIVSAYARELNYPMSFFEQALDLRSLPTHFWRKKARTKVPVEHSVAARMNILRMQLRALLRSANVPENLVPRLDRSTFRGSPSDAARFVREKWLMARGPIESMVRLLEDHGVLIVTCDFGTADIDGMSVFDLADGLPPLILVNPHAPGDRLRWSLAHELAHLVLHSDPNYVPNEETEDEADEFAGEFTMPAADIRTHLRTVTLERLATLKLTWKMSIGSLIMRAKRLDLASEYKLASLWKEMNRRGWRMREPNPIPREETTLTDEILAFHYEELGYADEQMKDVLHMFPSEIRTTFSRGGQPALRRVK